MSRKITVTEALFTRKVLKKRIESAITSGVFIGCVQGTRQVPVGSRHTSIQQLQANIQSDNDRVTNGVAQYRELVSKILVSNATTTVTVSGTEMTVAEAIELRNSISFDKLYLLKLKEQKSEITRKSVQMERTISDAAAARVASNKTDSMTPENIAELERMALETERRERNLAEVDPCNITQAIDSMEARIQDISDNLENVLNVSNATTYIEVSF